MKTINRHVGRIFIAAPREISVARFKQIVRHYLPKAPLVLGISTEPYVIGFENQPQFAMLSRLAIQPVVDKINTAAPGSIEIIEYSQPSLPEIIANGDFGRVLLVNGSWKYTFQNHPTYKVLNERNIPFKYISPFVDEEEAMAYEASHSPVVASFAGNELLSEAQMLGVAKEVSRQSFDYSFQTGAALGRNDEGMYRFVLSGFNKVVPYQTYALHHGNSREKYNVSVHDTSHYDTIHAEMHILTKALAEGVSIKDTTLFINLLPCPNCARVLSQTDIKEILYEHDHSEGYAVELLEASGKTVRHIKTARGKVH